MLLCHTNWNAKLVAVGWTEKNEYWNFIASIVELQIKINILQWWIIKAPVNFINIGSKANGCCLFTSKPLPKPMLTYCWLDPLNHCVWTPFYFMYHPKCSTTFPWCTINAPAAFAWCTINVPVAFAWCTNHFLHKLEFSYIGWNGVHPLCQCKL